MRKHSDNLEDDDDFWMPKVPLRHFWKESEGVKQLTKRANKLHVEKNLKIPAPSHETRVKAAHKGWKTKPIRYHEWTAEMRAKHSTIVRKHRDKTTAGAKEYWRKVKAGEIVRTKVWSEASKARCKVASTKYWREVWRGERKGPKRGPFSDAHKAKLSERRKEWWRRVKAGEISRKVKAK